MLPNGRNTALLSALCAATVCAAGCGQPTTYRIKTNVPWPDEWALGPRDPYHRELPVSEATIRWHRHLDAGATARDIERRLADAQSVFAFVRTDFARRRTNLAKPDPRALPYVEARVVPLWLLPADMPTAAQAGHRTELLDEAVERLAGTLGRLVVWREDVDLDQAVTVPRVDDPREALMRTLLENDLFLRCEAPAPRVFRSLEYRSRSELFKAIDAFVEAAAVRPDNEAIHVLPLAEWAMDYVNRVCGGVEAVPFDLPGKHLGLLSSDDLTEEALARIKRQLEATLPYHVR